MKDENLRKRTKDFSLRIVKLFVHLPRSTEAYVIGKQLLRSGTSAGAHYHEAQRAKSDADFVSKIEGGLQELEETFYWLELLRDSGIVNQNQIASLIGENDQLIAIFVKIVKSVKEKKQ